MSDAISAGSVSRLLGGLHDGDGDAVGRLWRRFARPMVRLARRRLRASGGPSADAEDVALAAFWAVCGRVAGVTDRRRLWGLLACVTGRRAIDAARRAGRRRTAPGDLDALPARAAPAEFTAAVADLLETLPSDELRRLAVARMEGRTNDEIARDLGRSVSTVERKLQVIRAVWREAGGAA